MRLLACQEFDKILDDEGNVSIPKTATNVTAAWDYILDQRSLKRNGVTQFKTR